MMKLGAMIQVATIGGWLLAPWAPAAAQSFPRLPAAATEVCEHVPRLVTERGPPAAAEPQLYRRLLDFMASRSNVPTLGVVAAGGTARWQQPTFTVSLNAGREMHVGGRDWPEAWPSAFYTVIVRPIARAAPGPGAGLSWLVASYEPPPYAPNADPGTPAHPESHGARIARTAPPVAVPPGTLQPGNLTLTLEFTPPPGVSLRQRYEILVFPCFRPTRESTELFALSYGRYEVTLNHPLLGLAAGLAVVLGILGFLGFAAARGSPGRLASTAAGVRRRHFLLGRFSPAFICQDSFGTMNLAAFQVLLVTLALLGVYTYAFVLTGNPPTVQPSVLTLAGITLAGSALATAAARPTLESANRLWLLSSGLVTAADRVPRWSDLLLADGQVDISRVQALAFTLFAVAALVVRGAEDLDSFAIPDQLNYLLGLSQGFYVAGKALPAEAAKRVNEDVRTLAEAQREAIARGDRASWARFDGLKTAVRPTLQDLFGERFDAARLAALEPGAPPP
jgi:hypothetical protein